MLRGGQGRNNRPLCVLPDSNQRISFGHVSLQAIAGSLNQTGRIPEKANDTGSDLGIPERHPIGDVKLDCLPDRPGSDRGQDDPFELNKFCSR